jgi:hypothetical protein
MEREGRPPPCPSPATGRLKDARLEAGYAGEGTLTISVFDGGDSLLPLPRSGGGVGRGRYSTSAPAFLPNFLRSFGSSQTLRRRIDFGVTSTRSSSSI